MGIAIGIEDPFFAGVSETSAQSAAITLIAIMGDDAQFRVTAGKFVKHCLGVIFAAVVDDNDLVIVCDLFEGEQRGEDHAGDCATIVISRKKGGNPARKFVCHGGYFTLTW